MGFPRQPLVKNLPDNAGDTRDAGLIPESGRSSGGGKWQSTAVFLPEVPWTEGPGGLQSTCHRE